MQAGRFEVTYAPDVPPGRPATRRGLRIGMTGLLALGVMILTIAVSIVIAALVNGHWSTGDINAVPGFIVGGAMAYIGFHGVKRAKEAGSDEELGSRGPYVFLLTDDTVEFPGTQALPAESWVRATTTASVRGIGILRRLTLKNPGKRSRSYLIRILGVDPGSIAELFVQSPH